MHLLFGFLSTILCFQYFSSLKNDHSEHKKAYISQPESLLKKIQCAHLPFKNKKKKKDYFSIFHLLLALLFLYFKLKCHNL